VVYRSEPWAALGPEYYLRQEMPRSRVKERRLTKALPATVGIMALLLGLMLIDKEIHAELVNLAHGAGASDMTWAVHRAQDSALLMFRQAKDQVLERGAMTLFTVLSGVLLLFMLKT